MAEYRPEEWVLIQIDEDTVKVFAGWRGGYISSDSWRMNSGIAEVKEDGDYWLFIGHSGSIYRCRKEYYGIKSPYNESVLVQTKLIAMKHCAALRFIKSKLKNEKKSN